MPVFNMLILKGIIRTDSVLLNFPTVCETYSEIYEVHFAMFRLKQFRSELDTEIRQHI